MCGLTFEDWDEKNDRIIIRVRSGNKKKSTESVVPLIDKSRAILEYQKEHYSQNEQNLIFVNTLGNQYKTDKIRKYLLKILKRHNWQGTTHWIRHSTATYLIHQNINVVFVKEYLRHEDIKETMRYIEVDAEKLREKVSILNTI